MDIRTEISPSEVMKKEASTNAEAAQSAGTSENARESACRELGSRILYTCRSEVCARFPFFSPGIAALSCEVISREKSRRTDLQEIHGIGTDGSRILADPMFLIRVWEKNPGALKRGYLHILFHCLYLHPFSQEKAKKRLWNLACDLAAELLLKENIPEDLWGFSAEEKKLRGRVLEFFGGRPLSAEVLYHRLEQEKLPFSLEEMEQLFAFDDHSLWKLNPERAKQEKSRWEKILTYTTLGKEHQKHRIGANPGNRQEELEQLYKSRYDYRKFLKKFAFPREEIQLDEESFDYIFYHFGMEHYGNLPLIEPLEYKEVNRLEELVIAIDTSGSCSRELVRRFLGETYQILSTRENFFRKMKVYIIQCDCCIQSVSVIHSEEEWKEYVRNVQIQGRSGTDFVPVFTYIKKEREKKELKNLKALIYFTDGDGIYPGQKPDYETAFVFVKKNENMKYVPNWAYKLVIS